MRIPHEQNPSPQLQTHMQKLEKHDHRVCHIFRRILRWIEWLLALLTIVVLLICLGVEIYKMITVANYFASSHTYLHNMLTIVVGLEFVRMLIDVTPATILEVLTVAITRQVIVSHDSAWSALASVVCIAGLFAIRRFLVRRQELKEDLVEVE